MFCNLPMWLYTFTKKRTSMPSEVVYFSERVDLQVKQYLFCNFPRTARGFDSPKTSVSALGCNKFQCSGRRRGQKSLFLHPQGLKSAFLH